MKNLISAMLALVFLLLLSPQSIAQSSFELVNERDMELLDSAVYLMDNSQPSNAIKILDGLCKKYPNNYVMHYERLYAFYKKGDYKRVVKEGQKLYQYPDATSLCYHLVGNAQDYMKKTEEALATYDEGIKRFPNSGELYLEKGNIYAANKLYNEAATCYTKGAEVSPQFASNYYWLAKLYGASQDPLWGILYGEVAFLIDSKRERAAEMSRLIYDLFNEHVKMEGDSGKVSLTTKHTVIVDSVNNSLMIPFELVYELGISNTIPEVIETLKKGESLSIAQIAKLRKGALEFIDSITPGRYNVSIIDFHRELIESGNWEAYNIWLMNQGATQEAQEWADTEEGAALNERFGKWFESNYFRPTKEAPTLATLTEMKDVLHIPNDSEISTVEGCRGHRNDALRLSKWLLEQPLNPKDETYLSVRRFLVMWMTNTDEFTFTVMGESIGGNIELLAAYMAAITEHAIDFNQSKIDESMYCEVMLQVIEYYKRNKGVIGEKASMENYLKMDGATLHDVLAQEYKDAMKEADQTQIFTP